MSTTTDLLGGIDVLAYVTGSPSPGTVMEKNYDEWEYAARLLTISPAYLARKVAEVMIEKKTKGKMVFSASLVVREPSPNLALSDVCRVSILGLVRTLARELAPKGIRVNAILPGYIKTGRIHELSPGQFEEKGDFRNSGDERDRFADSAGLHRFDRGNSAFLPLSRKRNVVLRQRHSAPGGWSSLKFHRLDALRENAHALVDQISREHARQLTHVVRRGNFDHFHPGEIQI